MTRVLLVALVFVGCQAVDPLVYQQMKSFKARVCREPVDVREVVRKRMWEGLRIDTSRMCEGQTAGSSGAPGGGSTP